MTLFWCPLTLPQRQTHRWHDLRCPARVSTNNAQPAGIVAPIEHGLSNARVEAINTQIRMITRRAYGFHSARALIALAMLSLAGLCPPLPR